MKTSLPILSSLVALCLFLTVQTSAQNWVEEGAEYRFLKVITLGFTGGTIGCETRTLEGDTTIGTMVYQRLGGEYFSRDWTLEYPQIMKLVIYQISF